MDKFLLCKLILLGGSFFLLAGLGGSQVHKETQPYKVYGKDHPLVGIKNVAIKDSMVVVLTSSSPSIHIFKGDEYKTFGKEGPGPGELRGPTAVKVRKDRIFVLDWEPGNCKIVSYDFNGKHLDSIPIRGVAVCYDFEIGGNYKVLEIGEMFSDKKKIALLGNQSVKKVIMDFAEPHVRINTPKGPMRSLSFQNPFVARSTWDVNKNGELVTWDGKNDYLTLLNIKTGKKRQLKIPIKKIKIPDGAINNWIDQQFSSDETLFGIQDPFKNVRKKIKQEVNLPDNYPLLAETQTDPKGGTWLLKAFHTESGQVWSYLSNDGEEIIVSFPENRSIISFGKTFIVAKTVNSNGVEYIELYNRDRFL